jgi:hypothetical protein
MVHKVFILQQNPVCMHCTYCTVHHGYSTVLVSAPLARDPFVSLNGFTTLSPVPLATTCTAYKSPEAPFEGDLMGTAFG